MQFPDDPWSNPMLAAGMDVIHSFGAMRALHVLVDHELAFDGGYAASRVLISSEGGPQIASYTSKPSRLHAS